MIILAGTLRIDPADIETLRPHAVKVLAATRNEVGCIAYTFALDLEEPGLIRVFEKWRRRDDLDDHFKTAHMTAWRKALGEVRVLSRDLRTYEAADGEPI